MVPEVPGVCSFHQSLASRPLFPQMLLVPLAHSSVIQFLTLPPMGLTVWGATLLWGSWCQVQTLPSIHLIRHRWKPEGIPEWVKMNVFYSLLFFFYLSVSMEPDSSVQTPVTWRQIGQQRAA